MTTVSPNADLPTNGLPADEVTAITDAYKVRPEACMRWSGQCKLPMWMLVLTLLHVRIALGAPRTHAHTELGPEMSGLTSHAQQWLF